MTTSSITAKTQQWLASAPQFEGHIEADLSIFNDAMVVVNELIAEHETALQEIQTDVKAKLLTHARAWRRAFCNTQTEWLYQQLPLEGEHLPLSKLCFLIAEKVPFLVPNPTQLAEENKLAQQQKQGLELDQGILLGALLAHPQAGKSLIENQLKPSARALSLLAEFEAKQQLDLGKVAIAIDDGSALIEFNNGDCLNAEDNQLIDDLTCAVDLTLLSEQVSVGVLRGGVVSHPRYKNKRIFSAGINLKHISQGEISFCDFIMGRELGYINKMMRGLNLNGSTAGYLDKTVEKPWIAAVDTFAIGGGMQLLFACDYVLGASDSYVSLPAAKEGIIPGVSNLRLPRRAHGRLAKQVILHGRRIFATEADGCYVFDKVVEPPLMDQALADARQMMKAPAVIANRKMLRLSIEPASLFQDFMAEFAIEQSKRLYSADVLAKVDRF